jgi:hypothetical protein
MDNTSNIPEVENVLGKIGQQNYHHDKQEKMNQHPDLMQLSFQIQHNIGIINSLRSQQDFNQVKMAMASNILRSAAKNKVEIHYQISSTVFGELQENFTWTFQIEGKTDTPQLEALAEERTKQWNAMEHNNPVSVERFSNIFHDDYLIQYIFEQVSEQLGHDNMEHIIFMSALILFDLECLSAMRQSDMLVYLELFNQENYLDTWLSCLDVHIDYLKPLSDFSSYTYRIQ